MIIEASYLKSHIMGGWCNIGKMLIQLLHRLKVGQAGVGEVAEQRNLLVHHLEIEMRMIGNTTLMTTYLTG